MVSNSSSTSYAIDFGTSNTAIARWNPATEKAELVTLPNLSQQFSSLPPLIPSLVYVEDAATGKIIAGQEVRDRGLDIQSNPVFSAVLSAELVQIFRAFYLNSTAEIYLLSRLENGFYGN